MTVFKFNIGKKNQAILTKYVTDLCNYVDEIDRRLILSDNVVLEITHRIKAIWITYRVVEGEA
jgi:hypothetical protein